MALALEVQRGSLLRAHWTALEESLQPRCSKARTGGWSVHDVRVTAAESLRSSLTSTARCGMQLS